MAYEESLRSITLEADADFSAGDNQYKFVKASATQHTISLVAATTDRPLGVVQNLPKGAGHAATIGFNGVSKVQAGGALAVGDPVKVNASGQAVTATPASDLVVGYALQAATGAGVIVPVLLALK